MVEQLVILNGYLFFGMIILLILLELVVPALPQTSSVSRRWVANIGLFLLNNAFSRFIIPISSLFAAELPITKEYGVLNQLPIDSVYLIIIAFFAIDFFYYLMHRVFHRFKSLWRLHLIHHTDVDVDVTTTERHHPLEAVLSSAMFFVFVIVIGLPAAAILLFAIVSTIVTLLSHANLRLPAVVEAKLSWLVVTPAVHSVHHSADQRETDSNFGVVFTLWDRLFCTYCELKPGQKGPIQMGLEYYRDPKDGHLLRLLWLPCVKTPTQSEPLDLVVDTRQLKQHSYNDL